MLNVKYDAGILVAGDVMLDRYVHGAAQRLSPEAPVPVLKWAHNRDVAGGAANVAANIAALGGKAALAGVVGADDDGRRLSELLAMRTEALQVLFAVQEGRPTTVKTRFVSNGQQLLRLDVEDASDIGGHTEGEVLRLVEAAMSSCSVVVLSDYRKGVLTAAVLRHVIAVAREADRPVVIDPKRSDWEVYAGASVITPNRTELHEATGLPCGSDAEVEAAARQAAQRLGAAVLVTRSERGMTLVERDKPAFHIPALAREVFDVSGAGDTVVAVLATCLASGMDLRQAVRTANVAAGIVVGKHGTATLTLDELNRALRGPGATHGRLAGWDQAQQTRAAWREQGLTVGFANGCFDILHPGHVSLIDQAADACDRLIVALNTDASVRRLKGPRRPVQDERSRAAVMGALSRVDLVVLFDEDTPMALIDALRPDVLVKGADYREEDVVGADLVKSYGGRVVLATLSPGQSTTSIVQRSQSE